MGVSRFQWSFLIRVLYMEHDHGEQTLPEKVSPFSNHIASSGYVRNWTAYISAQVQSARVLNYLP